MTNAAPRPLSPVMKRFLCILGFQLLAAVPVAAGIAQGSGADSMEVRLTRELTTGRVRLPPLQFTKQGDRLDPASAGILKRVARAMASTQGGFIIEAHVKPTIDPTVDQANADRRASLVRAGLIELGVPAARLFAVGVGRERSSSSAGAKHAASAAEIEHIDIARLR
jgi:outer membrane protein OmpA-like peptidoglycan-associated protein